MPFDMTPTTEHDCIPTEIERLNNVALGIWTDGPRKLTIADKRNRALAAYDLATATLNDPATTSLGVELLDWQEIATALASFVARPKVKPLPLNGEWKEYTAAQRRGGYKAFMGNRKAVATFADGVVITVQLPHRNNQELPDWERAARSAIGFYKHKRERGFLAQVKEHVNCFIRGGMYDLACDFSRGCAVPEITQFRDLERDTLADIEQTNKATALARSGENDFAAISGQGDDLGAAWADHYTSNTWGAVQ